MPTVISYDDPALVAALAGNVSDQRGKQQNFQDQLQSDQLQQQAAARQQQAQIEQQRMAMQASMQAQQLALEQQRNAPGPTPAYTEGGNGAGPTIYHPAGEQMLPPGQMQSFDAAHQVGAFAGGGGSGQSYAHLPRVQQQVMQQLDAMHSQGQLDDTEYARRRGIAMSGGDPFSEPTTQERNRDLQFKQQQESQYQQHEIAVRQAAESEKQRAADMAAERQGLLDMGKMKEARLKDATLSEPEKKMLHTDLDNIGKQLADLPKKYSRGGQQQGQPGTAGGPGEAKPLPRSMMQTFILAAGGDPQKAKALAMAKGFNPNNIVDDRPGRGVSIARGRPGTGLPLDSEE